MNTIHVMTIMFHFAMDGTDEHEYDDILLDANVDADMGLLFSLFAMSFYFVLIDCLSVATFSLSTACSVFQGPLRPRSRQKLVLRPRELLVCQLRRLLFQVSSHD